MYRFSQRLAWMAGVALPIGETLRRWGTWWEFPPAYLDDLLAGAFLLGGAWISHRSSTLGPRMLAAAYGFACGIGYLSFALNFVDMDRPDPAGVSGATATMAKAVLLALGIAGLIGSLIGPPNNIQFEIESSPLPSR